MRIGPDPLHYVTSLCKAGASPEDDSENTPRHLLPTRLSSALSRSTPQHLSAFRPILRKPAEPSSRSSPESPSPDPSHTACLSYSIPGNLTKPQIHVGIYVSQLISIPYDLVGSWQIMAVNSVTSAFPASSQVQHPMSNMTHGYSLTSQGNQVSCMCLRIDLPRGAYYRGRHITPSMHPYSLPPRPPPSSRKLPEALVFPKILFLCRALAILIDSHKIGVHTLHLPCHLSTRSLCRWSTHRPISIAFPENLVFIQRLHGHIPQPNSPNLHLRTALVHRPCGNTR
jgi:hypothetical protein